MEQKSIATVMKKFNLLRKHLYFIEYTFEELVKVLKELEEEKQNLLKQINDIKIKKS